MITLTTITKNGEIHKQETKPKRFRPIDGWERQKDGSFIRKLDDPRWITMEEMRQKIQEKKKRESIKLLPPHPDISTQQYNNDRYIPKFIYCQPRYSRSDFLSKLDYMYGAFEGSNATLHNVRIKEYINCSDIKISDEYVKITIDFKKKEIYFQKSQYGPIMKVHNLVYE